jgi:lipopolysaccharide/colanic/teichoic acid biosynthesis glycosyltransferase
VGLGGRRFRIVKFRTMRADAEADGQAAWAAKNDPRVTGVGRLLRRMRLDEIPQFLNVLKGDMTLVGPRPERPEFVVRLQRIIPHYALRHLVKPGVTGWAQIMHSYGASDEAALEKLKYDLYYIKNGRFSLDIAILLRTLGALMRGSR